MGRPGRSTSAIYLCRATLSFLLFFVIENGAAQGDLSALTDEFDNPASIADWSRVYQTESWGANQLEEFDIDTTRPGFARMVPYSSSWFDNWRGVLAYKLVEGDFVVTTRVQSRNRAETGPPGSQYSLAGIMIRTPRNITPATWTPGGENYLFLSFGAAGDPGNYQFEVKTTVNSMSTLVYEDIASDESTIQAARFGEVFILLRRTPTTAWTIHRRYHRPDMPQELQVGMTCYTDWPLVQATDPFTHNGTAYAGQGNPDLVASFDYYRFQNIELPQNLMGLDLLDEGEVPDSALLSFLGDNLPSGGPTPTPTTPPSSVSNWRLY